VASSWNHNSHFYPLARRALLPGTRALDLGCGEGLLEILEVQKPGGRRLAARDFLRGQPLQVGEHFTLTEM